MPARSLTPAAGTSTTAAPVIDLLSKKRRGERQTPYGAVWDVVSVHGLEAAVVTKHGEEIDPGWFSQEVVDLVVLLRGHLRVEFDGSAHPPLTMQPGQMLVIEPGMRCRAYRWPRYSPRPAVFLAIYPKAVQGGQRRPALTDAPRHLPASTSGRQRRPRAAGKLETD